MLSMDFTLLILRVVLGLIFIGHGTQKLFSWFGGRGINATGTFFSKIGFYPGSLWAFVAGLAEALGGLGLALGLERRRCVCYFIEKNRAAVSGKEFALLVIDGACE